MYRLAAFDDRLLDELELDMLGIAELEQFLASVPDRFAEYCDGPFRPKPVLKRQTRFSDGSFSVFYSSLRGETAEAEVRHWLPHRFGKIRMPRTVYYERFSCEFIGTEIDLRGKESEWPELVEDDYTFCNRIGAEARRLRLDGLLTPSARHPGANQPVFQRNALSDPRPDGLVAMTYDPATESVASKRLP